MFGLVDIQSEASAVKAIKAKVILLKQQWF